MPRDYILSFDVATHPIGPLKNSPDHASHCNARRVPRRKRGCASVSAAIQVERMTQLLWTKERGAWDRSPGTGWCTHATFWSGDLRTRRIQRQTERPDHLIMISSAEGLIFAGPCLAASAAQSLQADGTGRSPAVSPRTSRAPSRRPQPTPLLRRNISADGLRRRCHTYADDSPPATWPAGTDGNAGASRRCPCGRQERPTCVT